MTPPDEVLRKMAEAVAWREGIRPLSPKRDTTYLAYQGHMEDALTAAAECGWKLVPAAEHKRLSERVAALDEPYIDDRGEHWIAPTAFAYAAVCRALRTCKGELGAARAGAEAAGVGKRVRKEDLG